MRRLSIAIALAACSRTPRVESTTMPDASPPIVVTAPEASAPPPPPRDPPSRLSDESTIAIGATRMFVQTGSIKDPDAPLIEAAMKTAYAQMRREEDEGRTEHIDSDGGDLMLVGPRERDGHDAIIFLHGWGGRFALPCWQVARATRLVTACPDAGVEGAWWSDEGERIVRRTLDALHAIGKTRIVLVGLSNGASGAMRLPQRIAGAFQGVVLVSGANPIAGPAGIPALVVHGKQDGMAPAAGAREYAKRTGAKLVMLDRGHFAMLLEAERFERAIADFVTEVLPR
jgi:pimeloyl-ACP methyl ester carboxylesterase